MNVDAMLVMTAASLVLTAAGFFQGTYKTYRDAKEKDAKMLADLRGEVKHNLDVVMWLDKQKDKSAHTVYDPAVRKQLEALRCTELKKTSDIFDRILKDPLKKAMKKTTSKKDAMFIFVIIKTAAQKTAELIDRLERVPEKPAANAPKIILKRRIPALLWRYEQIDKAFALIPVAKKGK